ncbi:MAG: hypothetical protein SFY69_08250 [Planctomycetota bacterium]|nr:hypothetical protein [Planctomycetota bacterium]
MTQAPAAPSRASLSRDDLVRIGRDGRPWEFLPLAAAALALAPADHGLRFLAAANLARLGLKALAEELLLSLPDAVRDHPDIRGLASALSALPRDLLSPDVRMHTLRTNLDACPALAASLHEHLGAWTLRQPGVEWYRALDGTIVRRAAAAPRADLRVLAWLANARAQGVAAAKSLRPPDALYASPAVIEGLDPPWTLLEAWRATMPDSNGYRPRLWVVQADPGEALDGLASADLREPLADARVRVLVGPDAGARLRADLASRHAEILPGLVLSSPFVRARVSPALGEVLSASLEAQGRELDTLHARVQARYAPRDRAFWAARYDAARAGGPPLRVLVPISRHSTFVRHAADDLARALRDAGCVCEVLTEPDAHARLSAVAYVEALDRLDPDLIVLVNFTRRAIGEAIPANVPFVTWIQDAMSHLLDAEEGRAQGPLDLVAGHLLPELFGTFGYPRERTLAFPVVASEAKFHDAPVDPALAARLACDIAFVTHHSEAPEAMLARLLAGVERGGPRRATLERIWQRTREHVAGASPAPGDAEVRAIALDELRRELGADPPGALLAHVTRSFALPLADRLLRHQTIAWASDICERRGWRLRLYGRGWDAHPAFARWAHGDLEHAETLRAAYRCAGVTIHASITTTTHQRVMECALSGGLPVCRLLKPDFDDLTFRAALEASRREEPTVCHVGTRLGGHLAHDHPECRDLMDARRGLGLTTDDCIWVSERRRRIYLERDILPAFETTPQWLLGGLGEGAFRDAPGLERLAERAIGDGAWRRARSSGIASRVRTRYTHRVFARSLLGFVHGALASRPAGAPSTPGGAPPTSCPGAGSASPSRPSR